MDLKARALRSALWYVANRFWGQAISWAVTIVLARLLMPSDYGLFAMALTVITFLELFQEFGLGAAIIQRQDMPRDQLSAVFWIVTAASAGITLLAFLGAGLVAWFFVESRLIWMIRALALSFLLDGLAIIPHSLLTKEIDFRRRSLAEGGGVLASAIASVALAALGFGVWALVAGHVARAAVRAGALWTLCGWMPSLTCSFRGVTQVVAFGLRIAGATVFKDLSTVGNNAIIGHLLGSQALGLYSMAESVGRNPVHRLTTSVINQLSLPVFSKLQREDERLRASFLKVSKYLAAISLPMYLGMAVVAWDLVVVLLSAKWLPMVVLFQVFSLGGIAYVLPLPSTPLLTARGQASLIFRFSWITTLAGALGVAAGTRFGIEGVAAAWMLVFVPSRFYLLWLSLRELAIPVGEYFQTIAPSASAAGIMGVVVYGLGRTILVSAAPWERLVAEVALGVAVYAAVLFLRDRAFGGEIKGMVRALVPASRA